MVVARFFRGISGYLVAIVLTSVTTLVVVILNRHASIPNVSLLYLPVVLFTAVYFGTWSSLTAATLAALEYDFFLLPPAFTLTIVQAPDVLAFLIFVIVAVLTSQLAAGARSRAEAAQRRARESETLYELGRSLMSTYDVGKVLQTITERIVDVFRVSLCAVFVPLPDGGLQLAAESVRGQGQRDRASESSAAMVFENGAEVDRKSVV